MRKDRSMFKISSRACFPVLQSNETGFYSYSYLNINIAPTVYFEVQLGSLVLLQRERTPKVVETNIRNVVCLVFVELGYLILKLVIFNMKYFLIHFELHEKLRNFILKFLDKHKSLWIVISRIIIAFHMPLKYKKVRRTKHSRKMRTPGTPLHTCSHHTGLFWPRVHSNSLVPSYLLSTRSRNRSQLIKNNEVHSNF